MADARNMLDLAVEHHHAGRLDEAARLYRQILETQPQNADAWHLLGLLSAQQGEHARAIEPIRKAIELQPNIAEYRANLANVFVELGRLHEALDEARIALKLAPHSAEAFGICGTVFQGLEQFELAVDCHRQAVALQPDSPDHHNDLANALRKNGDLAAACAEHLKALELKPGWDVAINNYATTLLEQGEFVPALQQYGRSLELLKKQVQEKQAAGQNSPELLRRIAQVLFNLGNAFRDYGEIDAAIKSYQQSLQFQPDFSRPRSNHIYLEQFLPGANVRRLSELRRDWDQRIAQPLRQLDRPFGNDRSPDRKLRLGILSPNFGNHPAGFLMIRGVEALDRDQFELVCYSDRSKQDAWTERFQARADEWKPVLGIPDGILAEMIRMDAIDILIVTSGHTANSRLQVAARKPAPVQIAWTGDPASLSANDGLIADEFLIPESHGSFHPETIIRMPHGYATFDPPPDAPDVGPLPCFEHSHITFGSFNQAIKYHAPLLECWAQLMGAVPDSRLLLIGQGNVHARPRLLRSFEAAGISGDRIQTHDKIPRNELLAAYRRVDIGLDSFPFSGGVTTLESLWMGVPVVTLPAETFAGRTSLTWLSQLGLTDLIATDEADYVRRAQSLAEHREALAIQRSELRDRMRQSPILDGGRFATDLTQQLRSLWQQWCRS